MARWEGEAEVGSTDCPSINDGITYQPLTSINKHLCKIKINIYKSENLFFNHKHISLCILKLSNWPFTSDCQKGYQQYQLTD